MLFIAAAISVGVSMSVRAGAGACAFDCGFGFDAFATLVRLRVDFSLRSLALSSFTSFFSCLIFLSFFDIALRSPRRGTALAQYRNSPLNVENRMTIA